MALEECRPARRPGGGRPGHRVRGAGAGAGGRAARAGGVGDRRVGRRAGRGPRPTGRRSGRRHRCGWPRARGTRRCRQSWRGGGRDRGQPAVRGRRRDGGPARRGAGLGAARGAVRRARRAGGHGRIVAEAPRWLARPGSLLVEMAPHQAVRAAAAWRAAAGFGSACRLARPRRPGRGVPGRPRLVTVPHPAGGARRPGRQRDVPVAARPGGRALRAGEVVALPTDTVYGLAALPAIAAAHRPAVRAQGPGGRRAGRGAVRRTWTRRWGWPTPTRLPDAVAAHRRAAVARPADPGAAPPAGLGYALGEPDGTVGVRCPDHDRRAGAGRRGGPARHHQRQPPRGADAAHRGPGVAGAVRGRAGAGARRRAAAPSRRPPSSTRPAPTWRVLRAGRVSEADLGRRAADPHASAPDPTSRSSRRRALSSTLSSLVAQRWPTCLLSLPPWSPGGSCWRWSTALRDGCARSRRR